MYKATKHTFYNINRNRKLGVSQRSPRVAAATGYHVVCHDQRKFNPFKSSVHHFLCSLRELRLLNSPGDWAGVPFKPSKDAERCSFDLWHLNHIASLNQTDWNVVFEWCGFQLMSWLPSAADFAKSLTTNPKSSSVVIQWLRSRNSTSTVCSAVQA